MGVQYNEDTLLFKNCVLYLKNIYFPLQAELKDLEQKIGENITYDVLWMTIDNLFIEVITVYFSCHNTNSKRRGN